MRVISALRYYWPVTLFFVFVAAWSAWWFVAASMFEDMLEAMRANPESDVRVTYEHVAIGGYPFRIEADFRNLEMEWRGGRFRAEKAVAHALAWKLSHIIAEAGGEKSLTLTTAPGESMTITPDILRLSAFINGDGGFRVDAVFGGAQTSFALADGRAPALYARLFEFHARSAEGGGADLLLAAADVELQRGFVTTLGDKIPSARFDARFKSLPPGDSAAILSALESWPEFLARWASSRGAIDLNALTLNWGRFEMTAKGALELAPNGDPEGALRLDVKGSDGLIAALQEGGAPYARLAGWAVDILSLAGFAGGTADALSLPLELKNGELSLDASPG